MTKTNALIFASLGLGTFCFGFSSALAQTNVDGDAEAGIHSPITGPPDPVRHTTGSQMALDSAAGGPSSLTDSPGQGTSNGSIGAQPFGNDLDFQADLLTGRFTYRIPIKIAPARQGSQPSLVLGYSSAGPSGWCGLGWSLEVGYIQRDTRKGVPIQWSTGSSPLTQYDDSKGFIANVGGATVPLILVNTTVDRRVYRPEVDTTFSTYNYYNDNHWEIVDKSGTVSYFGETSSSRMENPKPGWTPSASTSTFRWALDKVFDTNGNGTVVSYVGYGNLLYLSNISYGTNRHSPTLTATHTVDFNLEDQDRPDKTSTFISGYRVETQKRLSSIQAKVNGTNVCKYVLSYISSPSTTRSLLASVTEYGSDCSTHLPPVTFNYQVQPMQFEETSSWSGMYHAFSNPPNPVWNEGMRAYSLLDYIYFYFIDMVDIDGDGLPDRVMRKLNGPHNYFAVQRNTGTGFYPANDFLQWTGLDDQDQEIGSPDWNSPRLINKNNATVVDMVDINGDGYPDRVMRKATAPYDYLGARLNSGDPIDGFGPAAHWAPIANAETQSGDWLTVRNRGLVEMVDMNGDGLPDRVTRKKETPFDRFKVELNTGTGFTSPEDWMPLDSQNQTSAGWNSITATGDDGDYVILADINGDGLPDRVMRNWQPSYTTFVVQFNNGFGFEPAEPWGPVDTQNHPKTPAWGVPRGAGQASAAYATLMDINGDGLPDRIMRKAAPPYTDFVVQLNTGSGFGSPMNWGPIRGDGGHWQEGTTLFPTVTSRGITADFSWISVCGGSACFQVESLRDLFDLNGDGLPDRILEPDSSGHFYFQLNKGPFPDLLNVISNGIGGSVQISYIPSTSLDNRDRDWSIDPWTVGAKSLLPFPVYVVSQVTVNDGLGQSGTTTYSFKGGYYEPKKREFRGFCQATVTDPLGTINRTYFHQSGGRDLTGLGEYQDQNSFAKKGFPFRTELIGSDGKTNRVVLNKVEEVMVDSHGCYFPFISQTIVMNFDGLDAYRATAKQLTYDHTAGNLVVEANLGEVTDVVAATHSFTDTPANDSVYTRINYIAIGTIRNKPFRIKVSSDSAGNNVLRDTLYSYDSHGNLASSQSWLDTISDYITTGSTLYDQYGNPTSSTDAASITTTIDYDSACHQYPVTRTTTSSTYINHFDFDYRSGSVIQAVDMKGLVSSNFYDVFCRQRESWVSTIPNGLPTLWRSRTDYLLGGTGNYLTTNSIRTRINDAVDADNGHETYVYYDGLGRAKQSRVEAETGAYRITDTFYDQRGSVYFQTLLRFNSGTNYSLPSGTLIGALTEYDQVGRAYRETPAEQATINSSGLMTSATATGGDSDSPVGPVTTAFHDGNDPWATVVTDSENKVKKSFYDAYGRIVTNIEVTATENYTTRYTFDLVGNLTQVIDHAGNLSSMAYDSIGRKISMTDPDMGTWTYAFDNADRLIQQVDARYNSVYFFYDDPLGRISSKEIYNAWGFLSATTGYLYDSNQGDSTCTVYPGQLYKVTDREGYEKFSYDARGRTLQSTRYVLMSASAYTISQTYDDADRIRDLTYPYGSAVIRYSYDTAGHVSKVESLSGTGTKEIFYVPTGFNDLGQITGCIGGNGVTTAYSYFPNSARLQSVTSAIGGTTHQNLTYKYNRVSNLTSIWDHVYAASQSGSLTNVLYDDLHRMVQATSIARGPKTYTYDPIGNILTHGDSGSGQYQYGSKPHAVTSANGKSYDYDACGNMVTRGNAALDYDEENQLVLYSSGSPIVDVSFGYADGGERLWRYNSDADTFTVWIGGLYEETPTRPLCHVFANGKRIATFEPVGGGPWAKLIGEERWHAVATTLPPILNWPFQNGRTPFTLLLFALASICGICVAASRQLGHLNVRRKRSFSPRLSSLTHSFWRRSVTFATIVALLLAGTPKDAEAVTYTPVFYYYLSDHLGSSNILTDRSGELVQHYESTPFGKTAYSEDNGSVPLSNRFTDQIFDEDTGLYYYGSRYYDPELGRFIQADTEADLDDPQGLNRYSYVGNNPLNTVDPSGHFIEAPGWNVTASEYGGIMSYNFGAFTWYHSWVFGYFQDDNFIQGSASDSFVINGETVQTKAVNYPSPTEPPVAVATPPPPAAPPPASPPPPTVGPPPLSIIGSSPTASDGTVLKIITAAAGIVSTLPLGPVSTVAAVIELGGNLLQGDWKAAAWSAGGAVASMIGAKVAVKLVAAAIAARRARKGIEAAEETVKGISQIDRAAFKPERKAFWKAEAKTNPRKYSPEDLAKMERGRAPTGSDGHPMELHHVDRTPEGGITPMSRTDHRLGENYKKNHP